MCGRTTVQLPIRKANIMVPNSELLASAPARATLDTTNGLAQDSLTPTTSAAPDTAETAPTASIPWDTAVAEGKAIIARNAHDQKRLGEIAHNVETKYGDRTLAKLAKEIGISQCTLERHRSVYRAWMEKPAPGPVSYAVM